MLVGGTHPARILWFAAIAALLASLLLAAGPAAPTADAGTRACKRFGDVPAYKLRKKTARRTVTCLLNQVRKRNGMSKLGRSSKLKRAAQRHTRHMRASKCFAHECPGEPSLEQRLWSVGYLVSGLLRWAYGENIAWGEAGYSTPRAMVRAWMDSPPHRANILNSSFEHVGVGVVRGTPYQRKAKGAIFTTDFGLRHG